MYGTSPYSDPQTQQQHATTSELRRNPSTSSNAPGRSAGGDSIAKADQIVQHIYSKSLSIITQARLSPEDLALPSPSTSGSASISGSGLGLAGGGGQGWKNVSNVGSAGLGKEKVRTDKWFNLDLPEHDSYKSDLRPYRSVSSLLPSSIPPLTLSISLDSSDLAPNQALVLSDSRGRRTRVSSSSGSPKATARPNVVLETWTISFDGTGTTEMAVESLPSLYKTAIISLRSLFTLVRTLPAYNLSKRLNRRVGGRNDGLKVRSRILSSHSQGEEITRIGSNDDDRPSEQIRFPGIVTPLGTLSISVTYRLNTDFSVETIEALLSSTFIDQDFFRPTVARYQREREREERRPGSLPTRESLVPRGTTGASAGSSPIGGITAGFNVRPSYGSLSSRHHLASSPPSANVTKPDPVKIPLPTDEGASSSSASVGGSLGRSAGTGVEPAFVSLSRARGTSYTGRIERATPLSSSPSNSGQPILRRPSFTSGSASSGSPIFRPGSYISSPPLSSSPLTGPTSNINRVSTSNIPSSSSLSRGTAPRPIPSPSNNPGIGIGISAQRTYSNSGGGGSYSRSFGRGSSGGSISGGEASGNWAGPESLGRRTGRLSFDGRYGGIGGGRSFSSSHATVEEGVASSSSEKKKFLPGATDDSEDINSFLGMIDSRPDLSRGMGRSGGEGSIVLSKVMVDETLKKLAGSVYSEPATGGGAGAGTSVGSDSSPRLLSGLRHQSSRLSIEEEPAEEEKPKVKLTKRSEMAFPPSRVLTAGPSTTTSTTNPSAAYPPTTYSSASSSTSSPAQSSLAFPQYIQRAPRASAATNVTTGFDLPPPSPQQGNSNSASIASFGEQQRSTSSYGGEEEAVGRLELSDEDLRGRDGPVAAQERNRDKTPGGGAYGRGYFDGGNEGPSAWSG